MNPALRPFRSLALAAALSACGVAVANAHPHAFIENRTDVVFNKAGQIIAINVAWVFDTGYTQSAIEGMDANGDGFYSAGELEPLAKANIEALSEYSYFVYARANGKPVKYGKVTEYGQIHTGGLLKMHFTLPLAKPLDPRKVKFSYKVFDPSFYIAIDYARKEPIAAIGAIPAGCKLTLGKVAADEEIEKKRQTLAGKDKEWQPAPDEEFGSLFAQPVTVDCKAGTS